MDKRGATGPFSSSDLSLNYCYYYYYYCYYDYYYYRGWGGGCLYSLSFVLVCTFKASCLAQGFAPKSRNWDGEMGRRYFLPNTH